MKFTLPVQHRFYSSQVVFLLMMMVGLPLQAAAAVHPIGSPRSVDVTIEDMRVQANEVFEIVLNVSDVSGLEITAFNLALLYDASLLAATSASIEGTLSGPGEADMTLVFNADEAGRIAIAAAGIEAITGAGSLVIITFQSLDQDGLASVAFEEITFNEGSPAAIGNSGSITVSSALSGDASLNGEVSAFDAAKVLQHAVFIDTLSTSAFFAADVSANNEVSSYDAALILQHVSGLLSCFPVEAGCGASKNDKSAHADFSWGPARPDGMVVHIPLTIDHIKGDIQALTFDIPASEEIDFTYDIDTRLPEGWIVSRGKNMEGKARISMAGLSPLTSDTLLVLRANANAMTNTVILDAQMQINEEAPIQLDVLNYEALHYETLPSSFSLIQNFPNPFNPATTISYTLQEDIQVSLIVYDALGREVSRLVDGLQNAGTHSTSFDAQALSSGIYIYKLEAGTFSQTRQMMLVK